MPLARKIVTGTSCLRDVGAWICNRASLYRWTTRPRHQVVLAAASVGRRQTGVWRQLSWFVLQLAVLGFLAWVWAGDEAPDKPSLGLVLFLGAGLAVVRVIGSVRRLLV